MQVRLWTFWDGHDPGAVVAVSADEAMRVVSAGAGEILPESGLEVAATVPAEHAVRARATPRKRGTRKR